MSRKRNENAVCGNCPYFLRHSSPDIDTHFHDGRCRRRDPDSYGWPIMDDDQWCGEHPNFFTEEPTP